MKELLLSEINHAVVNPLEAVALVEEFIFEHNVNLKNIEDLAEHCKSSLNDETDVLERAEKLINDIYVHQLFIDKTRINWSVASHQQYEGLAYRVISPILKSLILQHIIRLCDFECDIVFVPEKVMVRIHCSDDYSIIFDPTTGESLTWHDLNERLDDFNSDLLAEQVQVIDTKDLICKYLSSLKSALIQELKFDKALKCVDMLLAMRPDDPFERRDRGFLLHQLDCFKVAYDDYRFFVEQCPEDPAAQLLKYKLDNITVSDLVLH